jgi:hypothetical protein
MVQAIAAPGAMASYRALPSFTSLQSQLQRYQQQLSECVNCATADTPRGKADIAAIGARISDVQQRIAQSDSARTDPEQPARAQGGLGGRIDVFA